MASTRIGLNIGGAGSVQREAEPERRTKHERRSKVTSSAPVAFSQHFGIDPAELLRLGVFDPTLNADTRLFIDPLLLARSSQPEMQRVSRGYKEHFIRVLKLVEKSETEDDRPWRNARAQLSFPEIVGTCLGYGKGSIRGSGFGTQLTDQVLHTAKEVVGLGIEDPDLFPALALFESKVGADRIGDMVTNVILEDLLDFGERVLNEC